MPISSFSPLPSHYCTILLFFSKYLRNSLPLQQRKKTERRLLICILITFYNFEIFYMYISQRAGVKLAFQQGRGGEDEDLSLCYCLIKGILYIREESRSQKPFVFYFLPVFALKMSRRKLLSILGVFLFSFLTSLCLTLYQRFCEQHKIVVLSSYVRHSDQNIMPIKHDPHFITRQISSRNRKGWLDPVFGRVTIFFPSYSLICFFIHLIFCLLQPEGQYLEP